MRNRINLCFLAVVLAFASAPVTPALAGPITLLHKFAGGNNDGASPFAGLTLSDTTLFGTTPAGGDKDAGTVFSIKTNGTGFKLLHEFAGGNDDGAGPRSRLALGGTTLFGATSSGGIGFGTLLSLKTDGTGYTILRKFGGFGNDDGANPIGALTLSGNTLFGTTQEGGKGGRDGGTVYSIKSDGTAFTLLHVFGGGADDGRIPQSGLFLSGTTLFGTTNRGGDKDLGTLFSLKTDGTGFTLLHEFAGGVNDGAEPVGGLILSGDTLFGTTEVGGMRNNGTVFSAKTDGTGFKLLHAFAGGKDDGLFPRSDLTLSGTTLFGTAAGGGDDNEGVIFSLETDGTGFKLLHEFAGGDNDGARADAGLVLSGANLFGATTLGGTHNRGTVFSFRVSEPSSLFILGLGAIMLATLHRKRTVCKARDAWSADT